MLLGFRMGAEESMSRRRKPVQARSRATVDCILEGAARVFRREGWSATTNRVAHEAGVSIGSLYEYFPDKQALLLALAERHVLLAEGSIGAVLERPGRTRQFFSGIQSAILASQAFPSQALALVRDESAAGSKLAQRACALEHRVLEAMTARAVLAHLSEPELRARAAFGLLGHLSVRALFEQPDACENLCRHFLDMAIRHFEE